MFNKSVSPFTCILISLLVFALTFVGVSAISSVSENARINDTRLDTAGAIVVATEDQPYFETLNDINNKLNGALITDFNKPDMWDSVYRLIAGSLNDKYAAYLSKEEYQQQAASSDGDYVGIGVRVVYYDSLPGIYVYGVVEGSPAQAAGIKQGDYIIKVNGITFDGSNYNSVIQAISGKAGTSLSLTLLRDQAQISLTVSRAVVKSENVIYQRLDNNIAYVTVYSFMDTTLSAQFSSVLSKAQADGCDKFIFDVRNNPGGYLDQICNVLDMLLPQGEIITVNEQGDSSYSISSDENCITAKGMVVLCNQKTGSAAELFAAALRDYNVAQLVGETTYGKGTMQTNYQLPNGGVLKISTATYTPPSKISYEGIGITPHHRVSLPTEWEQAFYLMPQSADTQLQKAIQLLNSTN